MALMSGLCSICRVSRARCAPCCQRTWAPKWLCRGNAAPKASLDPRGWARGACLWVQRSSVIVSSRDACQGSVLDNLAAGVWSSAEIRTLNSYIISYHSRQCATFLFTSRLRLCTFFTFLLLKQLKEQAWYNVKNWFLEKVILKKNIYKFFKILCFSFPSLCISQRQVKLRLRLFCRGIQI